MLYTSYRLPVSVDIWRIRSRAPFVAAETAILRRCRSWSPRRRRRAPVTQPAAATHAPHPRRTSWPLCTATWLLTTTTAAAAAETIGRNTLRRLDSVICH